MRPPYFRSATMFATAGEDAANGGPPPVRSAQVWHYTLRAETAGVVAAAAILYQLGDLG